MKLQESNPLSDPPVICDREFRKLPDPLTGLVSAHVHFSVAAELAEAVASRPGSFAAAFIDALDAVDETSLRSRAKIQPAILLQ
jgi:hydroxyethylthiazole kinase-like sugar kinase family protein